MTRLLAFNYWPMRITNMLISCFKNVRILKRFILKFHTEVLIFSLVSDTGPLEYRFDLQLYISAVRLIRSNSASVFPARRNFSEHLELIQTVHLLSDFLMSFPAFCFLSPPTNDFTIPSAVDLPAGLVSIKEFKAKGSDYWPVIGVGK